ncbi:MAG TPA: hypothetical protein VK590_06750, partial [Saprospiraceae bacterium]|nr:hypothetical protein [Saprospiraceae bacterium]
GNESNGSGAMSLDSIYPPNNAWMPFNYFPISVRFSPYDDAIYECQANLSIETDAGGNLDDVTRPVLHWSKGPAKSQSDVMGRTIQEWESRHISVNRTPQDQNAPEYHRGVKYNWSTELGFRIRGKSNDESGTVSASFNYGMNVPKLNLPHNNITRDTGIIKFKFSTADAPSYNILPSYKIGQSNNSETPRYFNGTIYEKCVLQIAKSESFDSIYASQLWVIGQGLDLQTSSEQEVRDSLFKVVEYNFNFKDTGTYYYRVAWLSLPSESYSTDNLIYNSTLTRKFKIQTKTKVPEPPVEQGGGGCISNCQSLPQPLGADLQKDSVIKKLTIGKFEMKVDSLKWTSNRISGFGHILVPFLKNSYVKVKFENLLLNDSLAVKDGIVNAVTADWVPSKYAKKVSGEMDWDTTFTQTMDTYFQQGSNLLTGMILDIPMELPIGLDQMIMGRRYAIGIVGMEFTYEKAIFNAVMVMDFPHLGGTLSMGATNICFSPSGVDNKRMYLYSPVDKHYLDLNDADIWLSGDSNGDTSKCTFAKFDCGGLTALSVKGRMEFSKKILINDSPTGSPDSLKNVTGRFSGLLQKDGDKWNHIYSLDIDPFQIPGGEGWGMHLKKAWLDYSLVKNPDNIVFPKSYESYDIVHFKGIYIESLDIKFPRSMSFGQVSNDGRFTLSVNNFIVDKNGVSGNIEAKNLIPINSGILSKMAFSLDTLRIVLNRNKFEESALIGQLKLSISTTPLSYKATINNNAENHLDYLFLIKPAKDMNIPIWKSKMDLLETSQIKLGFTGKNDSLSFESNFNGSMSFDSDFPVVNQVDLKLIKFEGFKLSIRSPHIVWGHWSLASPAHSLGGFPVTIDSIYGANRMHDGHLQAGIGMKVSLKVGGETNNFKAGTAFNIYAQLSDPGSLTTAQAWEYGGIEFDSVGIEGNVGIVSIKGNLKFYDENPTYGHGMRGTLHVEFKPKIAIDAVAQFGHKEGLQYWYVDASAKFSPGIPLAPGAQITGFGGGAWYHMHLAGLPGPEDVVYGANSNVSAVGSSYSGGSFVPDGSKLFGFEARMDLSAEKKNIY